ncbi:hypothetical protein [Bacillus cereus group sp. BfR-BA-01522]|nr:hypothetical protein [Bacillus cereus group sp. BfR-BA-01522]
MVHEILSAIFEIYRSFLNIYRRNLKYIGHSTQDIDGTTNNDMKTALPI